MINQIKLNNTMDDSELKKAIDIECKFLSNVFEQIKLFRTSETVKEKEIERHVQVTNRTGKIKTAKDIQEVQRAKTLEELHERLESYKSSKSSKSPNYERNLKKKIKKKTKLLQAKEERKKLNRQLAKERRTEKRLEYEEKQKLLKENNDVKPNLNEIEDKKQIKSIDIPVEATGSILFNKIDVEENKTNDKKIKDKPLVALQKLEKTNRLITKLKEKGNIEKAEKIKDRVLWNNVLNKADGVKVKDDKEKIKKSIKKIEERKKKSEKKWKEREENVQKRMEMKQKKRKENLKIRKKEKIKRKIKKSVKKGRTLPGINDK